MAISGNLRVTPETMLSISSQFGDCNNQVKTLTSQMLNIVGELNSTWAGEAATLFYSKLKGLEPDMQKLFNMIKEHTDDLQTMAKTYQQAEKANQQTASALTTAGIV